MADRLEAVARGLKRVRDEHGAQSIGALATAHSTLEELYLLQKLMRELGSGNVDFRLRRSDFAGDAEVTAVPWLGMKIAEVGSLDRVLVVGSQLRKDHPLLASRLRKSARTGAQISTLHCLDDDQLIKLYDKLIVSPAAMAGALAQIVKAAAVLKQVAVPDAAQALSDHSSSMPEAARIAASLASGQHAGVLLGNLAQHHPQAATLHRLGYELAQLTGAKLGFLGEAANSVGGYIAGAVPFGAIAGLNARDMLAQPRRAYLLLHAEVELDCHNSQQALAAMRAAEFVVCLSAFRHRALDYADVLLPVSAILGDVGLLHQHRGAIAEFRGGSQTVG